MTNFLINLKIRFAIVIRHVSQSTTSCLIAMTKGNLGTLTLHHWEIAITTGLGAGLFGLILSYGRLVKFQTSRYGVAFVAFTGTVIADYISHNGQSLTEALLTGAGAALLSFIVSFTPLDNFLARLEEKKE